MHLFLYFHKDINIYVALGIHVYVYTGTYICIYIYIQTKFIGTLLWISFVYSRVYA
jgi:hypothetical protein